MNLRQPCTAQTRRQFGALGSAGLPASRPARLTQQLAQIVHAAVNQIARGGVAQPEQARHFGKTKTLQMQLHRSATTFMQRSDGQAYCLRQPVIARAWRHCVRVKRSAGRLIQTLAIEVRARAAFA